MPTGDPWCPIHGQLLCQCLLDPSGRKIGDDGKMWLLEQEERNYLTNWKDEMDKMSPRGLLDQELEKIRGAVKPKDLSKKELFAIISEYMGDEVFAKRFTDCIDMLRSKNADYTAGNAKTDRVYNFRKAAEEMNLRMRQVWYVYAWKHWTAIRRYVNEGKVESEALDGRLNDIINYVVLLGAIIDEERNGLPR